MNKWFIVLDVFLLALYVLSAFPAIFGIPAHEWIGIFATLALVVHCAAHNITAKGMLKSGIKTARFALNIIILASLAICAVSGIMVSGTVLPTFGFYAGGYYFWDPLHAISAKVLMAVLFVHIVLNIKVAYCSWKAEPHASKREESNA
ncbi:DUF4405 domain-containing protein [Adlercreutzia sp. ZJ304]|uniref:DUF4405 domain-containing protein n=1 Tax=Adlercreutzia sp. ZJ304 TaxID=2709791 RepID=UPI0013EB80DA|nr:DUF4405 domain-containing protein [Adlercreutzia sp. ZJ304]